MNVWEVNAKFRKGSAQRFYTVAATFSLHCWQVVAVSVWKVVKYEAVFSVEVVQPQFIETAALDQDDYEHRCVGRC